MKAGDLLAEVRALDLDAPRAAARTARADIALSENLVAELRRTADLGATPGQPVYDAEARLAQQENAPAVARAKWSGLGLPTELLDTESDGADGPTLPVRAPVGRVVARVDATVGKVIEPSEPVAEVVDLPIVWVRVGVLDENLHRVKVGQPVEVRLIAHPGEVVRATIKAVSPYLDPATGVLAAWAELTNPPGHEPRFQPGMAGRADLVVGDPAPRPTVPAGAVLRQGVERFVLVEEANAAASAEYQRVPVVPGREANGRVEVAAGRVVPGDRVVTRGAHLLGPFFARACSSPVPRRAGRSGSSSSRPGW
ncbi:MAG: efflux RND transporter periplasmic adaptor subunit [Gemmataceae bacterium]|nr:efflux RND transporter periplasmic adaptor subunit [Gemmataceae bacterium]